MLVGHELEAASGPRRRPVVHAEGLETGVGHRPAPRAHRHHSGQNRHRYLERALKPRVVGVEQAVGAGLQLGDPAVDRVGAGAAARDHVSPHLGMSRRQHLHRGLYTGRLAGRARHHQVTLVAHHPPDLKARSPGGVGQASSVGRIAPAAHQPHVHVDERLGDATGGRGGDGGVGVDGHRDPMAGLDEPPQTGSVQNLVGQQQIAPEPGRSQALHLPHRGRAEALMPGIGEDPGDRGGLERLHMGPQRQPRPGRRHGRHVGIEQAALHDQARRRELIEGPRRRRHGTGPIKYGGRCGIQAS